MSILTSKKAKITIGVVVLLIITLAGWWMNMMHTMKNGDMSGMPCHQMMGEWMGDCEFDENGEPIVDKNKLHQKTGEIFNEDTAGLPNLVPTETVVLNDGDTYEMTAEIVKQEVGNRTIKRLAYNRMIPGPIIQASKGSQITLRFKNELDVETTLHSHGLRGEDAFDGVPKDMGGKQVAMRPGDVFEYKLDFPDTGVFWYHPHVREDYGQELGLYGNFHVTEDGYWNEVNKEAFLVLDDFAENEPFYKDETTKTLMGRFGNLLLINNQEDYKLAVQKNETVRFYMTNTANTRTFDIELEGVDMKLVGGDIGRIEKEELVENIIIAPSERWIFEAKFTEAGTFPIEHRGETIGTIVVSDNKISDSEQKDFSVFRNNSSDYSILRNNFQNLLAKPADKELVIDIDMPSMDGMMDNMMMNMGMESDNGGDEPHGEEGIEWEDEMAMMNQMSNEDSVRWILRDVKSGKENMNIDWQFKKDDLVKIKIFNDPNSMHPMQHPIHFHGQRFAVISRNSEAVENLQWEDTTLIRTGETIELILNTTNVGTWMSHCHIAEHLGSGMMFNFKVK